MSRRRDSRRGSTGCRKIDGWSTTTWNGRKGGEADHHHHSRERGSDFNQSEGSICVFWFGCLRYGFLLSCFPSRDLWKTGTPAPNDSCRLANSTCRIQSIHTKFSSPWLPASVSSSLYVLLMAMGHQSGEWSSRSRNWQTLSSEEGLIGDNIPPILLRHNNTVFTDSPYAYNVDYDDEKTKFHSAQPGQVSNSDHIGTWGLQGQN